MELRITHNHAKIGINKIDAFLSIQQPRANMEIKTTPADLGLEIEKPRVIIDQSQCFSEAGLKGIFELTEENAQLAQQAALEAIGNYATEGTRLAQIETRVNVIAEIGAEKLLPEPAEINIKFIPQSRPKIDVVGGVKFNPQMGKVDINIQANRPKIDVKNGSVEIFMLQKPEFHFEFVGNNLDIKG
jgi:hypothetical protein